MSADFVIADVFARAPGEGNQLAVFGDGRGLSDAFMQRAANEIGYSETTFVLPPETDGDDARLRIFTPQRELPFAGHPVVGSALVVAARGIVAARDGTVRFGTGIGTIEVRVRVDSERAGWAEMRQPVPAVRRETTDAADVEELARALGVDAARVRVDRAPIAMLDNGMTTLYATLDSLETVRAVEPNPAAITRLTNRFGCVLLAALATETEHPDASVHCRIFGPEAGVIEDPATGSANGPLAVYATGYGLVPGGEVVTEQGFEIGRPSLLRATVTRDAAGAVTEVRVSGDVFVTGEGRLFPW
jgi:trans-2,3-dihydro-3-hydroxyanthranilate isomerase